MRLCFFTSAHVQIQLHYSCGFSVASSHMQTSECLRRNGEVSDTSRTLLEGRNPGFREQVECEAQLQCCMFQLGEHHAAMQCGLECLRCRVRGFTGMLGEGEAVRC